MSKPSFSNIELWLFELSEGNLNPQQVEELRIFLLKHPELDVEKDVWEMAKIQPVAQSAFPNTAALEKKEPKRIYYAIGSVAAMLCLMNEMDTKPRLWCAWIVNDAWFVHML